MTVQETESGYIRLTAAENTLLQKDDIIAQSVDTTDGEGWVEIPAPDPVEIPEE